MFNIPKEVKFMFYKENRVAEKLLTKRSPSGLTLSKTIKDRQCKLDNEHRQSNETK